MGSGIDSWVEFFIRWWSNTVFGFFHAVILPIAISSYSAASKPFFTSNLPSRLVIMADAVSGMVITDLLLLLLLP
jgi:hypothetical protein